MSRRDLSVWWYRVRSTRGASLSGVLALLLLVGLTGGIAMASLAGARRTQASYPTFLASTNPSDLTVSIFAPDSGASSSVLTQKIERVPNVTRVRIAAGPLAAPLTPSGAPRLQAFGITIGSPDGLVTVQDRLSAVEGRLANPHRADEITVSPAIAQEAGLHLGEVVPLGIYSPVQESMPGFGTARVPPKVTIHARIVGFADANTSIIQDDIDSSYGFIYATPAFMKKAAAVSPANDLPVLYGIQLRHGASDDAAAERAITALIPHGNVYNFHVTQRAIAQAELAIKPESVALGGFGVIALLVCLVLAGQAVARQYRSRDEDRQVLRSLGAGPVTAAGDGLLPIMGGIVGGVVVALSIAVALSPLAPLGPVRPVYPHRGVAFDVTVLLGGAALLLVFLGLEAIWLCYWRAPHRRSFRVPVRAPSRMIGRVEAVGLPAAGMVGTRFALESRSGRSSVPVRSAMLGAVVAVATVVATLTFASSLSTLVNSPSLYGWNWTYALNPSNSVPPAVLPLLTKDRDVAAWSGYQYENVSVDGQSVPFLAPNLGARVIPPIVHGHAPETKHEIVLGSATMASLDKSIGDSVTLSFGNPSDAPLYVPPTRLRIVGVATFPAIGFASYVADHTSMGIGVWFPLQALPSAFLHAASTSDPNLQGPALVFVRLRPGVSPAAGLASLRRITAVADRVLANDPATAGNTVSILGVQRPAQIVNYHSIGSTPVLLAVGLAGGAVVALAFTLFASVRRRRRDLALLKALGFTPGQLLAAVAWQSTLAALVGLLVGLPLGIVLGRLLWDAFATNLNAIADPTVPVVSVILVGVGALVFANLIAALPGRSAARTSTAVLLRTE